MHSQQGIQLDVSDGGSVVTRNKDIILWKTFFRSRPQAIKGLSLTGHKFPPVVSMLLNIQKLTWITYQGQPVSTGISPQESGDVLVLVKWDCHCRDDLSPHHNVVDP